MKRFALLLLLTLEALTLSAGPKLAKLKDDVQRIRRGVLLVPPVLPDHFVLKKLEKRGPEAVAKYKADVAAINKNLAEALRQDYTFSQFRLLADDPALQSYPTYFQRLASFPADSFFVLQFGQAVQYATGEPKKIKQFDREFIGIYATDATSRIYLNAGKVQLFTSLDYARAIVRNMQKNLDRYATMDKKVKKTKGRLLVPALAGRVRLIERERLYGSDSTTFLNRQYQTVVTTEPVTLYRIFGGGAKAGGSFVTPLPMQDSAAVRNGLAILPSWGNTMRYQATLVVPEGTKLNIGIAGPQPIPPDQAQLPGGGYQAIMPYQWPKEWITKVKDNVTGKEYTPAEFQQQEPSLW